MRQGNSDSRISIGVMCRLLRCVAVPVAPSWPHAAAIGGAHDLVLHVGLARRGPCVQAMLSALDAPECAIARAGLKCASASRITSTSRD